MSETTTLEKCAGCSAQPGSNHGENCDWARCPDCGEQQLMCGETDRPAIWHGVDPRDEVARAKEWWIFDPTFGQIEDTFRVQVAAAREEINWNPTNQRYDA